MADLSDPAALGSDFSSQATTSRSTSTYDASLSAIEVATLTGVDHRAKNRPIAASRQPLLQAVASQFSTFQISTPQATTSRFTSTQELPPSTSLSHNLASKDTSIGGGSPHSPSPHMPYNNTAIPPPDEVTGSAALPCKDPMGIELCYLKFWANHVHSSGPRQAYIATG